MQIIASGNYYEPVTTALPELKELVKAASGKAVRRVDRFIQLALIGVGRCAGGVEMPADTAVYMASPRGDLEVTQDIIEQLFRYGQAPKPLSFINSVSNAASFYIAQNFSLQGRSNFICNRYFAFESALQLALEDFSAGIFTSALVGVVDVAVEPLPGHRLRAGVPIDAQLIEPSHWLWVGANKSNNSATVIAARHFSDRAGLCRWIKEQVVPAELIHYCAGQFMQPADSVAVLTECEIKNQFNYPMNDGFYDCRSGAAINYFQSAFAGEEKYLLHVNSDPLGRYSAFLVST
jgi:hypothetical protein